MRNFLIFLSLILISFTLLSAPRIIKAGEGLNLKPEKINPGSFKYPLKRIWEKISVVLTPSGKNKVKLYEKLFETRLSELNYVTENKKLGEIEKASQRFSFYAGVLAQEAGRSDNPGKKLQLSEKFKVYGNMLAGTRDKFEFESSYWLLIQQNIDTLTILTNDNLK